MEGVRAREADQGGPHDMGLTKLVVNIVWSPFSMDHTLGKTMRIQDVKHELRGVAMSVQQCQVDDQV